MRSLVPSQHTRMLRRREAANSGSTSAAASAAIICVVCPPTPRFFMSRPAGSSAMTWAGMPSSRATPASSTSEQPSKTTSPRLRSGSSSRTSAAGRSATEGALRCSSTTAKTTATTATGSRSSAAFCHARLARHQALEDVIVGYYRQTAGEALPARREESARTPAALLQALALGDVRDEGHLASALDGRGELALVAPAGAGDARRLDLASVADEAAQRGEVLVIDLVDLLFAEVAEATAGGIEGTAPLLVGSRPGFGARHALFLSRPLPRVGAACDSQGRACRDNGRGASPGCRLSEEKGRAADAASPRPPNRTRPPRTCVPAQQNPSPCRNSAGTQTCAGRPAEGRISRANR